MASVTTLAGQTGKPAASTPGGDAALRNSIVRFVRERFGIADSVKLSAAPLRPFTYAGFLQTSIALDDGKQKRNQDVYVSKDRRYLVVGSLFPLGLDAKSEIAQHVRTQLKVPEATRLTIGPFRSSPFPNLMAMTVVADDGKKPQNQEFFITKDQRCFVLGNVFDLSKNLRREALRTLTTQNHPALGPATAPVTIVEFADLQCPSCARFHEFLEKDLVPRYGGKVRVVFKEFPLANVHDWSLMGSIATQCSYQLDPPAYVRYRSLIFQNQPTINATNARDRLLALGEEAGMNRLKLATCIDAKVSLQRVEENFREGSAVGVQSTPTSFINGRMMVGMDSPEQYYKAVDEALRAAGR